MDQACIDKGLSETACSLVSVGLYIGYFCFFVALIALVVLPLVNAIKAPKELMKSASGIIALMVVFGVSYALSGSEVSMKAASLGITPDGSKAIGAGLIMLYTVFFLAVVGLVYSFFHKMVN